jgi:hypothetical protein
MRANHARPAAGRYRRAHARHDTVRFVRRPVRSRGVVALLAMLFMVIFAVLALGFYSQVNVAAQISANDRRAQEARVAAESGLAFLRYHLASVEMPPGLTRDLAYEELFMQLQGRLEGTNGLATNSLGYYVDSDITKDAISIPMASLPPIDLGLGTGQKFRATITRSGTEFVLRVVGSSGATTASPRGIEITLNRFDDTNAVFNYGVATRGPLSLSGGAIVRGSPDASRGSVLSTAATNPAISINGGALISGKVDLTNPAGTIAGSGSIGGTTVPAFWPVTKGFPSPEFPTVNPEDYFDYMKTRETLITTSSNPGASYTNIRIKAGVNPNFSGHATIKGVILIDAPNKVSFSGGTTIIGVIVVSNPTEATATNSITFSGGSTLTGPENLPEASFGELTKMTGGSILAPNFTLTMSGGATTFGGSVISKSVTLSGGATGTTAGSVISMGAASTSWSGGAGITLGSSGTSKTPAGVEFTGHYEADRGTYLEFIP